MRFHDDLTPGVLTPYGLAQPTVNAGEEVLIGPADGGAMTVVHSDDTHIGKPYHDGIKIEGIGLREAEGARRFQTMQLEELLAGVADHFGTVGPAPQQHWAARVGELRLIGIDSSTVHDDGGYISPEQLDAVHAELLADADRPTFVFAHHPITRDAAYTNAGGPGFIVPEDQARRLQESLAATPGAAAMFAGHTHRTRRGRADVGHVDFCERGACLGYPGGYTLLDVREGGYMVTFHRTPARESLDWSARTRWSLLGFEPEYMLGSVEDRNYSVHRGF